MTCDLSFEPLRGLLGAIPHDNDGETKMSKRIEHLTDSGAPLRVHVSNVKRVA